MHAMLHAPVLPRIPTPINNGASSNKYLLANSCRFLKVGHSTYYIDHEIGFDTILKKLYIGTFPEDKTLNVVTTISCCSETNFISEQLLQFFNTQQAS